MKLLAAYGEESSILLLFMISALVNPAASSVESARSIQVKTSKLMKENTYLKGVVDSQKDTIEKLIKQCTEREDENQDKTKHISK